MEICTDKLMLKLKLVDEKLRQKYVTVEEASSNYSEEPDLSN